MNRYAELGASIFGYLSSYLGQNGSIYDEVAEAITPNDQYAHTFFALAGVRLASIVHNYDHLTTIQPVLDYYVSLPKTKKGHREFNCMASLLSLLTLDKNGNQDTPIVQDTRVRLTSIATDTGFESGRWTLHGNNWLGVQALDYLLGAQVFGSDNHLSIANDLIDRYLLQWQLDDGMFYDMPRNTKAKQFETPVTYHAKFCMILLLISQFSRRKDVLEASLKGLNALGRLIAPNGEAFYYGRSNNSLFGYASAVYAYELAIDMLQTSEPETVQRYRAWVDKLFEYIVSHQLPSGAFPITLGMSRGLSDGWDDYMSHSVYNAYASAVLLMCPHRRVTSEEDEAARIPNTISLESAGFRCFMDDDFFCALHLTGQRLQPRYAGMVPLILQSGGKSIFPKAPVRSPECQPLTSGFLPLVESKQGVFSAFRWTTTSIDQNEVETVLAARASWGRVQVRQRVTEISQARNQWVKPLLRTTQLNLPWQSLRHLWLQALISLTLDRIIAIFPVLRCLILVDRYTSRLNRKVRVYPFSVICLEGTYVSQGNHVQIANTESRETICTVYDMSSSRNNTEFITYTGYDSSDGACDLLLSNPFTPVAGESVFQITLVQAMPTTEPFFFVSHTDQTSVSITDLQGQIYCYKF
jgi:hypothetical protein